MWTMNFQMIKLDLDKAEEPEIKLPTSTGSLKRQVSSRRTSTSALFTMWKPLCGPQQSVENSERDGNTRPPDLPLGNLYAGQEAAVRTGHGTIDCFQIRKGVSQGCILSSFLFNLYAEYIMRNWMRHKLESRSQSQTGLSNWTELNWTGGLNFLGAGCGGGGWWRKDIDPPCVFANWKDLQHLH